MTNEQRAAHIVDVLTTEFGQLMALDPAAFRRKFRKMAASPFAFYRGSASLFYADMTGEYADDRFLDERTSRVWIHGDLHAENFGTYMNGSGELVFNVNDFDEAYVGPFSWDLKRFAASVALIGYAKALSDDVIGELVGRFADAYLTELRAIAAGGDDAIGSITLANATGVLRTVLQQARLNTRVDLLDEQTTIDNYERRFSIGDGVFEIDEERRGDVCAAFEQYLSTLPEYLAHQRPIATNIKDVVLRKGVGIGSAGLPSYNLLLEGHTQALENDVVIYMKQAQVPAVARHIPTRRSAATSSTRATVRPSRSARCRRTPTRGWASPSSTASASSSPRSPRTPPTSTGPTSTSRRSSTGVVGDLGRAVARMHSVADDESSHDLVDFSTEEAIVAAIDKDEQAFVDPPGRVRPRVRRTRPAGPPALRRPLPQRPGPRPLRPLHGPHPDGPAVRGVAQLVAGRPVDAQRQVGAGLGHVQLEAARRRRCRAGDGAGRGLAGRGERRGARSRAGADHDVALHPLRDGRRRQRVGLLE